MKIDLSDQEGHFKSENMHCQRMKVFLTDRDGNSVPQIYFPTMPQRTVLLKLKAYDQTMTVKQIRQQAAVRSTGNEQKAKKQHSSLDFKEPAPGNPTGSYCKPCILD